MAENTVAARAVKSVVGGNVSELYTDANAAATDLVTGKDPLTALTDDLGITPEVTLGKNVPQDVVELPDNLGELINDGVNWGKNH